MLGPYRILHEIGRGGMDIVYLAERADGEFEQRVALKWIAAQSDAMTQRFRVERQILAGLNHPNIARLLDGGISSGGRLFFAMEYVDGTRIDRYCAERNLPLRDVLGLFATVCSAVQYAHDHLIVHRDLKPDNILCNPENGAKLLDFGVARLLDRVVPGGGAGELTRQGMVTFTPEYASPEQIRGEPSAIASDIYSLGVYRLLTGIAPYQFIIGVVICIGSGLLGPSIGLASTSCQQ